MALLIFKLPLLSYLISLSYSDYFLTNNANIRLISPSADCIEGRIEIYNGSQWGTFSDCTQSFTSSHAKTLCKSLGWDYEVEYWRGSKHYANEQNLSSRNLFIAYTKMSNCSLLPTEACSDCLFSNDYNQCKVEQDVHTNYDIFLECNNYGLHSSKNTKYECLPYTDDAMDFGSKIEYKSCSAMYTVTQNEKHSNSLIVTVVSIAIFLPICGVIIFALWSKFKEADTFNIGRFGKNYDEIQLQAMIDKDGQHKNKKMNGNKPMFMYHTRQIPANEQMDHDSINVLEIEHGGYNMEEIIYSKKISRSESYGLIANQNSDEDEEQSSDTVRSNSEVAAA